MKIIAPIPVAIAVALAYAPIAQAVDFTLDDGSLVTWTSNLSLGRAWRASGQDPRLLQPNNAGLQGITGATGGNTDDSDLNYNKGQAFTTLLNLSSEIGLKKGSFGGAFGFRAWKDFTLEDSDVNHGSFNNGYMANTPLKDTGFETFAKFQNVAVMNAYVYNNFDTSAGNLKVTVGRQVLNWGNDMFIQGVNQINAINLNATREPGLDINDIRLPQGMVTARLDLDQGKYLEAFYQFQFQDNVFPGCGTYFLPVDASVGPNTQNACAGAYFQALAGTGDAGGLAAKLYIPASATQMPSNGGQGGVSGHFPIAALNTDVGLYAMDITSRTPILSSIKGNSPFPGTTPLLGAAGVQSTLFWEYPKGIDIFGISASSKIASWTVNSELSYTSNFPVQVAAGDLIGGIVYTANPAILAALLKAQGVPAAAAPTIAALMNANDGPLGPRFAAAPLGGVVNGYDDIHKTQFQINAARGFTNVAGASLFTVGGELGFQWANVPGNSDGIRYGRAYVFGVANSPSYNLAAYTGLPGPLAALGKAVTQNGACPILNTTGQAGCANQGFVTPFSSGARLRGQLTYTNVFGSGVTLKPTLFLAYDIQGYSADGQFNQGRQTTALSLVGEYGKKWRGELGYTTYNHDAAWDPLRDRDYYSASVRYSF